LAGGYGYAGANPTTNAMYAPSTAGSVYNQTNPFFGGLGGFSFYG